MPFLNGRDLSGPRSFLFYTCYNRRMKSIVVANWKMNPATARDAKKLFEATRKAAEKAPHASVVVAPPALYLRELRAGYKGKRVAFAAQHAHAEQAGAFTGELSLAQYKDAGAQYVVVGHAERRAMGETDEETGKKVAAALSLKLTPILCVGETQRTGGAEYFDAVRRQLRAGLAAVAPAQATKVIIAYEPVWAIGKESAMSPRDMHEMAIFIRKTLVDMCGEGAMQVRILYGGSVDEATAPAMLSHGDVHGLLVGRVSENATRIAALLEAIEETA
jgi:triosephosphate isomerase